MIGPVTYHEGRADCDRRVASWRNVSYVRYMAQEITPARSTWPVGLRVSRKTTHELGTVVDQDGEIKVQWDDGRTSYYKHGAAADVELIAK
jgi:hypothetical protein